MSVGIRFNCSKYIKWAKLIDSQKPILGGAMAGVAMMETYHRYRLYRSMMYGGYGQFRYWVFFYHCYLILTPIPLKHIWYWFLGYGYGGYGGYGGGSKFGDVRESHDLKFKIEIFSEPKELF